MRYVPFILATFLVVLCGCRKPDRPAASVTSQPATQPRAYIHQDHSPDGLNLLSDPGDVTVKLGKVNGFLEVDGVKTNIALKEYEPLPSFWLAGDEQLVLNFHYDTPDMARVWDLESRKFTDVVYGSIFRAGRQSALVRTGLDTFMDIDPVKKKFRTVWQGKGTGYVGTIGLTDDGVWLIGSGKDPSHRKIVRIARPDQAEEYDIHLGLYGYNSVDSVRDRRMLLCGPSKRESGAATRPIMTKPPVYELAILDIPTGKIHRLGEVEGFWDTTRSNIHEGLFVQWVSAEEANTLRPKPKLWGDIIQNYVRLDTEEIIRLRYVPPK